MIVINISIAVSDAEPLCIHFIEIVSAILKGSRPDAKPMHHMVLT